MFHPALNLCSVLHGVAQLVLFSLIPYSAFAEGNPANDQPQPESVSIQWMGEIESLQLDESSGLAGSNDWADVLWSINDSGSGPELFAMTTRGKHLGIWPVAMADPVDWEAMASFRWQGQSYLLVADIGDNFGSRSVVSYTVILEPKLDEVPKAAIETVHTQAFVYPGGPRDAEAVAVDPQRGEVLVLSKRTSPPELYRLPLILQSESADGSDAVIEAQLLAKLSGFSKPDKNQADLYGDFWPYLGMPTGMSLEADRLLVTTLDHAYVFDRGNLAAAPRRIALPFIGQREAITFASGSTTTAYVSQEREYGLRKANIFRLDFAPVPNSSQQGTQAKQHDR